MRIRVGILSFISGVIVTAAQAQSVVLGLGYADFSDDQGEDTGQVSIEYHHTPFFQGERMSVAVAAAASATGENDYFIGAGVVAHWPLRNNWFIEGSVMPGYYEAGSTANYLGSEFEIRTLLGVGRTLASGDSISLALTHRSNASTAAFNPGVNAVLLRYHFGF